MRRPVLLYHGGKFRIRDWIIRLLPKHDSYIELFGGAASVLMAKPRSKVEVYNDLDDRVVNVFRVLRDPVTAKELLRLLGLTPFSRTEFLDAVVQSDDPVEDARRIILRAFASFGSYGATSDRKGFQTNKTVGGYGPSQWLSYAEAVPHFTRRLAGVLVENKPAVDVVQIYDDPDVLFYVDPPYVHEARSFATAVYRHEMDDAQHAQLLDVLKGAAGMVVLSAYESDLYNDSLDDWTRHYLRSRGHSPDGATHRLEVCYLNERAEFALANSTLPLL